MWVANLYANWSRKRELKVTLSVGMYVRVKLISQERIERRLRNGFCGFHDETDLARENWKYEDKGPGCLAFAGKTDLARENWKRISHEISKRWRIIADLARENWKCQPFSVSNTRNILELISQERIERFFPVTHRTSPLSPDLARENWKITSAARSSFFLMNSDLARENWKLNVYRIFRIYELTDLARENWKSPPPASSSTTRRPWSRKRELKARFSTALYLVARAFWLLISQERIESNSQKFQNFKKISTDLARENWKEFDKIWHFQPRYPSDLARENWKQSTRRYWLHVSGIPDLARENWK